MTATGPPRDPESATRRFRDDAQIATFGYFSLLSDDFIPLFVHKTKMPGYVYMMSNKREGTLYVGVTSDLVSRVHQHREGLVEGFTKRYQLKRLVWFEAHDGIEGAIVREKKIKRWRRAWKAALIEKDNPGWRDLWDKIAA